MDQEYQRAKEFLETHKLTEREIYYFSLGYIAGQPNGESILRKYGLDKIRLSTEGQVGWFYIGFKIAENQPRFSSDGLNIIKTRKDPINA